MPQSQRGGNLSLILIFWNGLEPPNAWTVTMGYAPRWLFHAVSTWKWWPTMVWTGVPYFQTNPFWLKQSFGNLQSFNTCWMWIVRSWNPTIYPRCFLDWRRGVCFCRLTFRFVWWVGYGQFQYTFLLVESCSFQSLFGQLPILVMNSPECSHFGAFVSWISSFVVTTGKSFSKVG